MNHRQRKKASTTEAVVKRASSLIRERGLARTSVQDAMAGAGLTVGSFYAHFDDKEDLLQQAVEQAMHEVETMVRQAANGLTGTAALLAVTSHYLSEGHRDHVQMGCPLPAILGEAAGMPSLANPEIYASSVEKLCGWMTSLAGEAVTNDQALALVALMAGGQIIARATRGTPMSSEVLASCRNFAVRQLAVTA